MNKHTEFSIDKGKATKLFIIFMLCFCFVPLVINRTVIIPLYISVSSNVAFNGSVLSVFIKYVQDALDLISFAVPYALIVFSMMFVSTKTSVVVAILYTIIFLFKIPLAIVMNIPIYGSLGTSEEITRDILVLLGYFVMEMLQLSAIYIISAITTNNYFKKVSFSKKRNQSILPMRKIISWSNPLQRASILISILIILAKIIIRVKNDIYIGAPTSLGEVMVMIAYYLSDFLYGVAAYIIILLVFSFLHEILKKSKKTDEEKSSSVE